MCWGGWQPDAEVVKILAAFDTYPSLVVIFVTSNPANHHATPTFLLDLVKILD